MKIVINNDYGGFGLGASEKCRQFIGRSYDFDETRTDQELIDFIKTHPNECGDLIVVTIPDAATDWTIWEYDGLENVVYVLDGKMHYAGTEDDDDEDCDEDDNEDWD